MGVNAGIMKSHQHTVHFIVSGKLASKTPPRGKVMEFWPFVCCAYTTEAKESAAERSDENLIVRSGRTRRKKEQKYRFGDEDGKQGTAE